MNALRHITSPIAANAPKLSVLIPFYKDDPTALLEALNAQSISAGQVEIIVLDDGTQDDDLERKVAAQIKSMSMKATAILGRPNVGRAEARNALFAASHAPWILFLDADMRPSSPDFLARYITEISNDACDVIFGGFEVEDQVSSRDLDLHRALSDVSDCLSADERRTAGAQFVASSNLCIRRDVLIHQPFDDGFQGWGWEDSEWAARIAKHYTLRHIDNPAIHLGLETTDTLLSRFATSGANYRRFVEAHPDIAPQLKLYRTASKLAHLPGQKLGRPILRLIVRMSALPVTIRLNALKLWRASWYAEALKS